MQALFFTRTLALASLMSLSGCQNYSFSINDKEIYTPPPLFAAFKIDDKALDTCIRQTIADQKVQQAEQLLNLNCRNAGIVSLSGLEQFPRLERVDLSGNKIVDGAVLRKLMHLKFLKIDENNQLQCADLPATNAEAQVEVVAPTHCQRKN